MSNSLLQNNMSSSQIGNSNALNARGGNELSSGMVHPQMELSVTNATAPHQPLTEKKRAPGHDLADDQESTDVSKAGDGFSPAVGGGKAGARESLQ